jgi:AcrR family transcriptional regulator
MSDPKGDPKSDAKADARTGEVRSESWIEAGLEEIARAGVEGVRVEVLAKKLGVTKGGFYRRFRDPRGPARGHAAALERGRIAAIEKHTSLDGTTARERLKALIPQYAERVNTEVWRSNWRSGNGPGRMRLRPARQPMSMRRG